MDQQKKNISCLTALIEFTLAIFYQYHVPDGTEGIQALEGVVIPVVIFSVNPTKLAVW